jgi:hypothetical protein
VRYADLVLHVPKRSDLNGAAAYDWGFVVDLCSRSDPATTPVGCEALTAPLVDDDGIRITVKPPGKSARFRLLKERPTGVSTPDPVPMLVVPDEEVDTNILGNGEAYELSRISTLGPKQRLTTSRGWPIAACDSNPNSSKQYCVIGFLIKGAFVEVSFLVERRVKLDQRVLWDIASAIDAKLRGISIDAPPRARWRKLGPLGGQILVAATNP